MRFRWSQGAQATRTAIIGNVLEWYDFAIYAFVASILAQKFFPAANPLSSQMSVFLAYGVGFLARPLGGIVIGRMSDVRGRKAALLLTMFLMASGTVAIGLLPTYGTIGIAAPTLLVVARLVQGFSAGGEWGGSTAYIIEWAPANKRGYYGSFQQVGVVAGILLGSATAAACNSTLTADQLHDWGWRIPFLMGGLLGPVGLYMRRSMEETPAFTEAAQLDDLTEPPLKGASPLALAMKAFGFTVLWTVATYMLSTYMPTWAVFNMEISQAQALWSNAVSLLVLMFAIPVMGVLSDRLGRKPLLLSCCIGFAITAWPAFQFLSASKGSVATLMAVQVMFSIILAAFSGPGPAAIAEIFPTRDRTTWMTAGYALSVAIFGGFAAFICVWLIAALHTPIAPSIYLVAAAVVSAAVISKLRETAFSVLR